jgi:Ca-activated chloride channel family protein
VRRLLPATKQSDDAALRVPFLEDFKLGVTPGHQRIERSWALWLALVAWILLITASARPEWLGDPIALPASGRDLMLAVDLSGSMEEQDFIMGGRAVNRLVATKLVAGDFITRRIGDRVGLILFGEQAYLQVPLTFDRETVKILLNEAAIGLAGEATAIGDAIGLAVKRLRDLGDANRVLILLTDGANTAGAIDPLQGARIAAKEGLKIYTVGIGADEMMVRDFFGRRRVNPSVELDEKTLRAIADVTGGRYFRATDTAELDEIYGILDRLEPVEAEPQSFRPRTPLYPWPLGMGMVLAALLLFAHRSARGFSIRGSL